MEDQLERKESKVVTAVLVMATIGILVAGAMVAETQVSAFKAGYLMGGILFYAVFATIGLGFILKSRRMPHPWASSSCVIALLSALILIWQSHAEARKDYQLTMALAIEHSLIYQFANDELIVMGEYPESTYGSSATPLTIINRELMTFQRKKLDQEVKQKFVGSLGFDSPDTFVDASKRSEALKKIALLKEFNLQNMKNAHDWLDSIRSDVEASDMSAADKRDLLENFVKGAQGFIDQDDSYFKLALEIDGLDEDLLNVAAADKPRLVKGHLIFNSDDDSKQFHALADKISAEAEDLRNMRAAAVNKAYDAAPYLKN